MKNLKIKAIAVGAIGAAAVAAAVGACADQRADGRDPSLGATVSDLASGAKQAAGGACTAGMDNNANENDCLTIGNTWNAAPAAVGMGGARSVDVLNPGKKLVYTGIDTVKDARLIKLETAFGQGFTTSAGHAMGAAYGAHGMPGWIQGLPDVGAGVGGKSILNESFGAMNIPILGLSVCWAGNTGAYAEADEINAKAPFPATYQNNIAAASFITTYYKIPASVIVACKNGVVKPSGDTLWCMQWKIQRDGWATERTTGNGSLIQGDGTLRGAATTKAKEDDATGDFSVTMQAEGPDADKDGKPDYPARYFKTRNLPTNPPPRGKEGAPWNLASRCDCTDGICVMQDNYPVAKSSSIMESTTVVGGGSGSAGSGSGTVTESLFVMLFGNFLTTTIQIEQPDGSFASVLAPTATPDGSFASFTFQPTMPGEYYIHLTDLDGLQNDPSDPEYPYQRFFVDGSGNVSPGGAGAGSGSGSGAPSCDHAICTLGDALATTCDPCAQQICAQDAFCCTNTWDDTCVSEVTSICGESCGVGSGSGSGSACVPSCAGKSCGDDGCGGACGSCGPGLTCAPGGVCTGSGSGSGSGSSVASCDHSVCVAGDALATSCDPCAAQVCAANSFCCSSAWDSSCVAEVASTCGPICGGGGGSGSGSGVSVDAGTGVGIGSGSAVTAPPP